MGNNRHREDPALRHSKLRRAENFRRGACQNCGGIDHSARFCLERPRKVGARWTHIVEKVEDDRVNTTEGDESDEKTADNIEVEIVKKRERFLCLQESYSFELLVSYSPSHAYPDDKKDSRQFPSVPTPADSLLSHYRLIKQSLVIKRKVEFSTESQFSYEARKILKASAQKGPSGIWLYSEKAEVYTVFDEIETYSSGKLLSCVNSIGDFFLVRSYNLSSIPITPDELDNQQMFLVQDFPNLFCYVDTIRDTPRNMQYIVYRDTKYKLFSLRDMCKCFPSEIHRRLPFIKVAVYNTICELLEYHTLDQIHGNVSLDTVLYDQQLRVFKLTNFMEPKQDFPSYKAPEMLFGSRDFTYSTACDVWSLGCLFGELLKGQPIFQAEDELADILKIFVGSSRDKWPLHPICLPLSSFLELEEALMDLIPILREDRNALDLIKGMLRLVPGERIMIESARKHAYLRFGRDDAFVETYWREVKSK